MQNGSFTTFIERWLLKVPGIASEQDLPALFITAVSKKLELPASNLSGFGMVVRYPKISG